MLVEQPSQDYCGVRPCSRKTIAGMRLKTLFLRSQEAYLLHRWQGWCPQGIPQSIFPDKGEWLGQGDFSGGDKERGRQKWPSDRMGGSDPSRPLLSEWRALIFLHWKTRLIKKLRGWSLERGELQVACRANAVLQVAYKSVVPRVAYTIVSTWWNKWTTFRNFHTTQNTCRTQFGHSCASASPIAS